jgi:hypothetical protein
MAGTTFTWNLRATNYPRPSDPPNVDWTGAVLNGVVTVTRLNSSGLCDASEVLNLQRVKWKYEAPWNCHYVSDWEIGCSGVDQEDAAVTLTLGRGDVVEVYYDLPDPQVAQINYYLKLNGVSQVVGLAAYGNVNH